MVKDDSLRDKQKIAEMYKTWKRGGKDGVQKLLERRKAEADKEASKFIKGTR